MSQAGRGAGRTEEPRWAEVTCQRSRPKTAQQAAVQLSQMIKTWESEGWRFLARGRHDRSIQRMPCGALLQPDLARDVSARHSRARLRLGRSAGYAVDAAAPGSKRWSRPSERKGFLGGKQVGRELLEQRGAGSESSGDGFVEGDEVAENSFHAFHCSRLLAWQGVTLPRPARERRASRRAMRRRRADRSRGHHGTTSVGSSFTP